MTSAEVRRSAPLIVALLAIAAAITGLTNGFALDDVALIVNSDRLHHLSGSLDVFTQPYWGPEEGSSLYRPFTSLAFLLQWTVGGGSPLPFHAVSIALNAAVSVVLYRLLVLLVDWKPALLASMIFAVHPVHTEAVANVVGQSELWAALFAILAVHEYVKRPNPVVVAGLYGVSLMFKEHVIVLPAVIVAYEMLVARRDRSSLVRTIAAMGAVGLAFVALRTVVIGEIKGAGVSPIFADASLGVRFMTMLRVVSEWARLSFWPASLSADYSPSRLPMATEFSADLIPGALILVSVVMLIATLRRRNAVVAFALAAAMILLLIPSNVFIVTGFSLAERTLFLPSAMVVVAASCGLVSLLEGQPRTVMIAVAILIVGAGVTRSALRNPVWRDNESLIINTVMDAPTSARAHMMMAQLLSDNGMQRKAVEETVRALELGSRNDSQLYAFAGDMFQMAGNCKAASPLYARSLALRGNQPQVRINAAVCASRVASSIDRVRR